MLTIDLPPDVEARLDALLPATGHSRASFAREAILIRHEDLEDLQFARHRLARGGEGVPLEDLEREFGIEPRS